MAPSSTLGSHLTNTARNKSQLIQANALYTAPTKPTYKILKSSKVDPVKAPTNFQKMYHQFIQRIKRPYKSPRWSQRWLRSSKVLSRLGWGSTTGSESRIRLNERINALNSARFRIKAKWRRLWSIKKISTIQIFSLKF